MSPSQKHLMYLRTNRRLGYIGLSVEKIQKFIAWIEGKNPVSEKTWMKAVWFVFAMWVGLIGNQLIRLIIT